MEEGAKRQSVFDGFVRMICRMRQKRGENERKEKSDNADGFL